MKIGDFMGGMGNNGIVKTIISKMKVMPSTAIITLPIIPKKMRTTVGNIPTVSGTVSTTGATSGTPSAKGTMRGTTFCGKGCCVSPSGRNRGRNI